MYKLVLLTDAQKFLKKLAASDRSILERIIKTLDSLQINPFQGKPLKHGMKGQYSLRVGVYRIIYKVDQRIITVFVLDIGHRKHIYQ